MKKIFFYNLLLIIALAICNYSTFAQKGKKVVVTNAQKGTIRKVKTSNYQTENQTNNNMLNFFLKDYDKL